MPAAANNRDIVSILIEIASSRTRNLDEEHLSSDEVVPLLLTKLKFNQSLPGVVPAHVVQRSHGPSRRRRGDTWIELPQ